jgi:hypothetical protein
MRTLTTLLLAAAVMTLAASAGLAHHIQNVPPGHREIPPDQCPLTGLNSRDQVTPPHEPEYTLNTKKNRRTEPADADIDGSVTLQRMLAPGYDGNRFDEKKGAVITGLVINIEQGGHPETANCGNLSEQLTDTHITVALAPTTDRTRTLVVEVTPWWRETLAQKNVDWSTGTLNQNLIGKRVTFRGWLMFDLDHFCEAINTRTDPRCATNRKAPWRKTIWEIHPVTSMQVVP